MIFELYGVPGAGKTTIINKVCETNDASYSPKAGVKSTVISIIKVLSAYIPSSLAYKRKIRKIISNVKMASVYTSASVNHNINNIVMVAFGYKHLKRTVYMDEGILHRIITFSINYNLGIEKAIKIFALFNDCTGGVKSFYLKVPIDECFKSIKKRNRHESEMDEMEDDKLWIFLQEYESYCNAISKKYGHYIITRDSYRELMQ